MDNQIINSIVSSFGLLWKTKQRGESLEIITPYVTTNDKFISVFLTRRNSEYIISDGAWLYKGVYENIWENEAECYHKVLMHYETSFNIQRLNAKDSSIFFYKKSKDIIDIPSLVFDLSNFIAAISSASIINFEDAKEQKEREQFKKHANTFLQTIIERDKLTLNSPLDSEMRSVRFSAVIQRPKNRLAIVNYITGSNHTFFVNSLCKANTNFEIARNSKYGSLIDYQIPLLNNAAEGYQPDKLYSYINILHKTTSIEPIIWTEKERISAILN